MQPDFQVSDDPAERVAALLAEASGHVVLTGGSTPRRAYEQAAGERDDWSGVEIWFTDERCVAPDHEHSNFGMVDRALLSKVRGANAHRMLGELGPSEGWRAIGPATMREVKVLLPSLWMQAITEAGQDPEIRRHVRGHMREVHDYFADVLRRVQAAGDIHPDRDPDVEAWIFVAGALLVSVADRLGGPLRDSDFEAIKSERHRWLTGAE